MQIWRLEPLKRVLVAGPLPDRQAVQYVAAQAAIVAAFVIPTPGQDLPHWSHFLIGPAVAIGGVYFCYVQNGGASGERFIERYFSVGWVVGVRVTAASIVIGAVGSILALSILNSEVSDDVGALVAEIVSYGLMVLTFWRSGVHIADVARRTAATPALEPADA